MSINDLLDSEILIPAIFVVFFLIMIVAIPAGIAASKKANKDIYGDNEVGETVKEATAKIVEKNSTAHPLSPTIMVNAIVFELENGNRVELAIKDSSVYGVLIVGDCGTLSYQGKKFVSFERNV